MNTRSTTIRLSQSEKNRLEEYREDEFDGFVPIGYVVGYLLDEVEQS